MEQQIIKKSLKFRLIKDAVYTFCFLIFFHGKILSLISPFAPAFLFALVWCGENIWRVSVIYLVASLTQGFWPAAILPNIICVLVLILCAVIQKRTEKRVNKVLMCLYLTISQLGKFLFVNNFYFASIKICEIAISLMLFASFATFLQSIMQRRAMPKFNADEIFCGSVFLISFACAISNLNFFQINFGLFFEIFLLLVFASVFGFTKGVIFACLFGVGAFLSTESINLFVLPIVTVLVSGIFAQVNKFLFSAAAIFSISVLGFYFKIIPNFNAYQAALCFAPCLIYLFITKKFADAFRERFLPSNAESEEFLNYTRKAKYFRFMEISRVFEKMDKIYKDMIKKKLSTEESAYMLSKELQNRMCEDCPNKKVCFRQAGRDMLNEFYNMFLVGVAKKQINLIDMPSKINIKCDKNKKMLAVSNDLLSSFVGYDNMLSSVNCSKLLISDQMAGVAQILKKLADDEKENLVFNKEKEQEILQNLIYDNITGVKSACVTESGKTSYVILIANSDLESVGSAEKIISKTMKTPFEFSQSIKSETGESLSYLFVQSPKCDVVFGVATSAKSGNVSGDGFSAVKIESGKFMLGICDGMGTGAKANRSSDATLNLIESYYKAGFDSQQIVDNINKIYMLQDEENFSTLDLCVLDLNNLNADFIKMGAPQTFIKKKNTTFAVSGGALPVGATEKASPKLQSSNIDPKDLIFMVSDGVSDCFQDENDLRFVISHLKGSNPQELANSLLEIAKKNSNDRENDDMTVFVSRVYKKV